MRFGRSILRALVAILVVAAILLVGAYIGGRYPDGLGPLRGIARDEASPSAAVEEAIRDIEDVYYRAVPAPQLRDDAIRGAVLGLDDRFSQYLSPKEFGAFQQSQAAKFTGIGVAVQENDDGLELVRVYEKSPARRAGLRTGDVLVGAGTRDLGGMSVEAATALVKGPEGSSVRLRVRRDGRTFAREVRRAEVDVPVVEASLVRRGGAPVGVIRLAQFTEGAHGEVLAAVARLRGRGARRWVLDLRGNPGGLVTEARLVASVFIDEGEIVSLRGRTVGESRITATGDAKVPDAPVVVVVDRGSASASEIVAGAIQDRDRGRVVGTSTFGKGVFQQVIPLADGGALDITAGQYFTPNGRNLGGRGTQRGTGIAPDVRAEDAPRTSADEALDAAVRDVRRR